MRFSAVATDLEFVKTGGQVLARSAAFVPFVARSPLSRTVLANTVPPQNDVLPPTTMADLGHRLTPACDFPGASTVLSLSVEEVLRVADVLPCGHVLLPHLERTLLSGDALEQLKAVYASEAGEVWDAFRALQKDLREQARAVQSPAQTHSSDEAELILEDDDGEAGTSETGTRPARPASSGVPKHTTAKVSHTLSPQEVALRRQFQMRAAIPRFYEVLDPYGVPNITRLDVSVCRALYTEDVSSAAFLQASQSLSGLRAYGRGKGRRKALAFMLRYYPEFAQQILRRSFPLCEDWITFLRDCRDITARELERVQAGHRTGRSSLVLPSGSSASASSGAVFSFVESPSLADLSTQLNHTWSSYLYGRASQHGGHVARASGCKFFAYGNSDAPVLHAALQSSCTGYQTRHLSMRAMAAGAGTSTGPRGKERFRGRSNNNSNSVDGTAQPTTDSGVMLSPVPTDVLVSPFQAKLLDVTQHTLFRASGFCTSSKKVPALTTALETLVTKDAMAAAVHELQQPHDPLWDAQALACICVGCGVVR